MLPGDEGEEVAISTTPGGNQVYIAFGKTEITSRLIDGVFPDYQRIIPGDAKTVGPHQHGSPPASTALHVDT